MNLEGAVHCCCKFQIGIATFVENFEIFFFVESQLETAES